MGNEKAKLFQVAEKADRRFFKKAALGLYNNLSELELSTAEKLEVDLKRAIILKSLGEHGEAARLLEEGIQTAINCGDIQYEGKYKSERGRLYHILGYFNKSIQLQTEASLILEKCSDKAALSLCMNSIGNHYNAIRKYSKSIFYYIKSLEIACRINDKYVMSFPLCNIANTIKNIQVWDTAREILNRTLNFCKEIDDRIGEAFCLSAIAHVYQFSDNDFEKALEYSREGLRIYKEIRDVFGVSGALADVGIVYYSKAEYDTSLTYFQESLQIAEKFGIKKDIANRYFTIALIYHAKGEYDEMLRYMNKSIAIEEIFDVKDNIADNYYWLGWMYTGKDHNQKALESYLKAYRLRSKLEGKNDIADVLIKIGDIYVDEKNEEEALKHYSEIFGIFRDVHADATFSGLDEDDYIDITDAQSRKDIAELLLALSKKEKEDREKFVSDALEKIVKILKERQDYDKVLEYYNVASQILYNLGGMDAFNNVMDDIVELCKEGGISCGKAVSTLEHYLKNTGNKIPAPSMAALFEGTAAMYAQNEDREIALEYYSQALEIYEKSDNYAAVNELLLKVIEIYKKKANPDIIIPYLNNQISGLGQKGKQKYASLYLITIAGIYKEIGDTENTVKYLSLFLAREQRAKSQDDILQYFLETANIFIEKEDYNKAVEYCRIFLTRTENGANIHEYEIKQLFENRGYQLYINPISEVPQFVFFALSCNSIHVLLIDSEPGDWLADEERFNDEEPLWFSERTHRVSPVWKLKTFVTAVEVFMEEFALEYQISPKSITINGTVIVTNGHIINAEDIKDEWDNSGVRVARFASGKPDNMPNIVKMFLNEKVAPPTKELSQFIEKLLEYLIDTPIELLSQDKESFRNYFIQLKKEELVPLFEVKLILLGEERAGKSSLAEALGNPDYEFDLHKISTTGISVLEWQIPKEEFRDQQSDASIQGRSFFLNKRAPSESQKNADSDIQENLITKDLRINIWDFGGQEIYHSTHQFFLTEHSIYIFLTEARKDVRHEDFYYWLNIIRILGGKSPVVVVLNKCDQPNTGLPIGEYRNTFENIVDYREVSCIPGYDHSISGLKEVIKRIVKDKKLLPEIGKKLPRVWNDIRNEIENLKKAGRRYISEKEYIQICTKYFDKDVEENALSLSRSFHNLGVFTHFVDEFHLKQTIFLDYKWITCALYNVLDNSTVIENDGLFTTEDLEAIWYEEEFRDKQRELLAILKSKKFELCYELEPGKYLAPHLLTPDMPKDLNLHGLDEPLSLEEPLRMEYKYTFMPKGILARFIVKLNEYIHKKSYWRYGVLLEHNNTKALVQEKYFDRKITIVLEGENKRFLQELIKDSIRKINSNFQNLVVQRRIACNCEECRRSTIPKYYEIPYLEKRMRDGKHTIECYESYKEVDLDCLLKDITLVASKKRRESDKNRIFISYSHNDKHWLDRLKTHLRPLQYDGNLDIWDDQRIKVGEKWEEAIENALNTAGIAILMISADFLASEFIYRNELPPILERAKAGGTEVFPLIVGDSLFMRNKELSQFQTSNLPEEPLEGLPRFEQEKKLKELAESIDDYFNCR